MASPLLMDLYEMTMVGGFFREGLHERSAAFDLYFRTPPFAGGFTVFAGLEPALEHLESLHFGPAECAYLAGLGLFEPGFLDFLATLRFRGRVTAVREGAVVFANEPLLTVEGTLAETQLVETALLNLINHQTLIATKAARITHEAGKSRVVEFGARRAPGPDGALSVARAAYIGGVRATSNLEAGIEHGIPVRGTQAHSWIMAFPDELTAFRAYARAYPDKCVLLVDTYDTLASGIPNAITVARELRAEGKELRGVRLDSGDLAWLSRRAREMFDDAGFPGVEIMASNELDEFVIDSIRKEGGRVDVYGVGTRLATGAGTNGSALGGVYKLVELDGVPRIKVSSDPAKSTIPGRKRLWRARRYGAYEVDILATADEVPRAGEKLIDPQNPMRQSRLGDGAELEDIRTVAMEEGSRTRAPEPLDAIADRAAAEVAALPAGCRRLLNSHIYKVALSSKLHELRQRLISEVAHEDRS